MVGIYYLFIDKEFCIQNVFENLQLAILEPGIKYSEIKLNDVLPPYIILTTIYTDQYLLELINKELNDMGYDKSFEILKPITS
jgi:hypothetical protein|uniref:Uncharacterized protein n=1 Tax=viral metagenome TaxID=1070528 RepID=A0A6C0AN06_9ZZZZ